MQQFERELLELLPRLRRFSRSLTHDPGDADDLCQLAIEKALRNRDKWQDGTRLDSWMFRITRNCWIDEQRKQSRRVLHFAPMDGIDETRSPSVSEGAVQLAELDLKSAMESLSHEQREAVALVWVEGLAYQEAADLLEIPLGTLTSRLARARRVLMRSLESNHDG